MVSNDKKMAVALDHLENKYGCSFEIVSFTAMNMDMPYDELVMVDANGNKFYTYIDQNEKGELVIHDRYYGILKAEDYDQMMRSILDRFFPEYKLFSNFTAGYFDEKYDSEYPLQEALKENRVQFFSKNYLFLPEKERNLDGDTFEKLMQALEEKGLSLYIAVYTTEDAAFQKIDEEQNVDQFLPSDYSVKPLFKKTIK